MGSVDLRPMPLLIPGMAKEEERAVSNRQVVEHAVKDLQFRDTLPANVFPHPGKLWVLEHFTWVKVRFRHPSVALAKKADEENGGAGPAAVDLTEANSQYGPLPTLILRDAPPEVNPQKFHKPGPASATQLWKNPLQQFIPLPH